MILNEQGNVNVNLTADENIGTGASISFSELESNTNENGKIAIEKPEISGNVSENSQKVSESDINGNIQEKKDAITNSESKSGKKVQFIDGTQTGELGADIKFKHKVDGKEVEWTLQELLNDKAGHEGHDKRFQALSAEKAKFQKEREIIENYIDGFQQIAKKGDAIGAMEYLAQLGGINPLEFKANMRKQLFPEFEKWQQMSEESRKLAEIEDENRFLKQQRESEQQRISKQQAAKELEAGLIKAQETYGFSDKDLVEAYDVLTEHYPKEKVDLNLITSYMKERNAVIKAEELISRVDTELLQNEKILDTVADLVLKGRHDEEEMLTFIQASTTKKPTKAKPKAEVVVDKKVETNNNNKRVPISFQDLE